MALAWVGGSDVGTHVGPLPAQTHDMGLGTPTLGDQDQLYVSQTDALAAARKTSETQHDDPARARTVAYRWGQWPERFSVALHGTKDRGMFPKDAGWSNADLAKVDAWASREYGISAKDEGGSGTDHLVPTTNPVEALSDRAVGITGPGRKPSKALIITDASSRSRTCGPTTSTNPSARRLCGSRAPAAGPRAR